MFALRTCLLFYALALEVLGYYVNLNQFLFLVLVLDVVLLLLLLLLVCHHHHHTSYIITSVMTSKPDQCGSIITNFE